MFLYAAVPKLLDWHTFSDAIARYRMLPDFLLDIVALIMPSLELVVGLMLILGVYRSTAAFMTILMNIAFMVAMSQALVRGLDTNCGCFSADTSPLSWWDVARDLVFMAMAWLVIRRINVFDDLIRKRTSTRAYRPRVVDTQTITHLLEAARLAPSSPNQQPWRFVVLDENQILAPVLSAGNEWVLHAPVVMAVLREQTASPFNIGLAVENMLLAATDRGLSGHVVGGFDREALCSVLARRGI